MMGWCLLCVPCITAGGFWVIGLWLKVLIVNKLLYSRLGVLYGQIYGVLLTANIETEFIIYDLGSCDRNRCIAF
jgi:hypothetical protein